MNEEREREELGELPEDLMRERNEVDIGGRAPYGRQAPYNPRRVPSDVEYQRRIMREQRRSEVKVGRSPPGKPTTVQSVFDTRPIQGHDFFVDDVITRQFINSNGLQFGNLLGTLRLDQDISGARGLQRVDNTYFIARIGLDDILGFDADTGAEVSETNFTGTPLAIEGFYRLSGGDWLLANSEPGRDQVERWTASGVFSTVIYDGINPAAIHYDEANEILYVGGTGNGLIQKVSVAATGGTATLLDSVTIGAGDRTIRGLTILSGTLYAFEEATNDLYAINPDNMTVIATDGFTPVLGGLTVSRDNTLATVDEDANPEDFIQFVWPFFPSGDTVVNTFDFNFMIADGNVAILRGFGFNFNPFITLFRRQDIRASILVNNVAAPEYDNLSIAKSAYMIPCHILADSGALLTLRVRLDAQNWFDQLTNSKIIDINCEMEMYGNILLDTGKQLEYEVGSAR